MWTEPTGAPDRVCNSLFDGWNAEFPPEDLICLVHLFGEESNFLCKVNCTGAPLDGYCLVVNYQQRGGGGIGAWPMRGLISGGLKLLGQHSKIERGGALVCALPTAHKSRGNHSGLDQLSSR